ncbi:MAG: type II secretion system F family protein [Desulfobacterales bacterium]
MAITINKKLRRTTVKIADTSQESSFKSVTSLTGFFTKPVKTKEIIFFFAQMSLMLEIGTSLTEALKAAARQTQNVVFRAILQKIIVDIEEGRQFSEAMKRHPKIFPGIITSMIKAGEAGGFLKKTLDRIVEIQEKRQAFIAQLRTTLTYPIIISTVGLGVVIFVLTGILPKFTALFEGKEALLPAATRMMMALSDSLRGYWWAYILAAVGFVLLIIFLKNSHPGRAVTEKLLISTPLIAKVTNKVYTLQLLRTLGNLIESQVPILEALQVTRTTFTNRYFCYFIDQIRGHVEEGGKFAHAFANYPYILESAKQMVVTGEETGNLAAVMLRLAEFYDKEVERELKTVSSMIEPLALMILGAVVGLIVASVVLPLFKISGAMR